MKILFLLLLVPFIVSAKPAPAQLRHSFDFIFQKVLEKKGLAFRPEVPLPATNFESKTPLEVFQDAIEEQWGMRPDRFSNAYSVKMNMVFLIDEASYYERTNRCMDDSLVHELVHYVQARYQGYDLNDDGLEWEAIDVQTTFREEHCRP